LPPSVNIQKCFVGIACAMIVITNHWGALLTVYRLCNVCSRCFVFVVSSETGCADVREVFLW